MATIAPFVAAFTAFCTVVQGWPWLPSLLPPAYEASTNCVVPVAGMSNLSEEVYGYMSTLGYPDVLVKILADFPNGCGAMTGDDFPRYAVKIVSTGQICWPWKTSVRLNANPAPRSIMVFTNMQAAKIEALPPARPEDCQLTIGDLRRIVREELEKARVK